MHEAFLSLENVFVLARCQPAWWWCCVSQVGLNYICATAERFFAVGAVLGNMVVMLAEQPSPRLLKHIIRCYLRLSDNPRWGSQQL